MARIEKLLTLKEAAEYLAISESTLYSMVSKKRLPAVRFGAGRGDRGNTRFRPRDLAAYIEANLTKKPSGGPL